MDPTLILSNAQRVSKRTVDTLLLTNAHKEVWPRWKVLLLGQGVSLLYFVAAVFAESLQDNSTVPNFAAWTIYVCLCAFLIPLYRNRQRNARRRAVVAASMKASLSESVVKETSSTDPKEPDPEQPQCVDQSGEKLSCSDMDEPIHEVGDEHPETPSDTPQAPAPDNIVDTDDNGNNSDSDESEIETSQDHPEKSPPDPEQPETSRKSMKDKKKKKKNDVNEAKSPYPYSFLHLIPLQSPWTSYLIMYELSREIRLDTFVVYTVCIMADTLLARFFRGSHSGLVDYIAIATQIYSLNFTTLTAFISIYSLQTPIVMLFSMCIVLKRRYQMRHWLGVIVCIVGVSLSVMKDGDAKTDNEEDVPSTTDKVYGNLLVLLSTVFYALLDILCEIVLDQAGTTQDSGTVEYLGMSGFFGALCAIGPMLIFERAEIHELLTQETAGLVILAGLIATDITGSYFSCKFLEVSEAALLNLSTLSLNFMSVIYAIVVEERFPVAVFYVGVALTVGGLALYETAPTPKPVILVDDVDGSRIDSSASGDGSKKGKLKTQKKEFAATLEILEEGSDEDPDSSSAESISHHEEKEERGASFPFDQQDDDQGDDNKEDGDQEDDSEEMGTTPCGSEFIGVNDLPFEVENSSDDPLTSDDLVKLERAIKKRMGSF